MKQVTEVEERQINVTSQKIQKQCITLDEKEIQFTPEAGITYCITDKLMSECVSYEQIKEEISKKVGESVSTKGEILLVINETKHYSSIILASNEPVEVEDKYVVSKNEDFIIIDFSNYLFEVTGNRSDIKNAYVCAGLKKQGVILLFIEEGYEISDIDIKSFWDMFEFLDKRNNENFIEGLD